MQTITDIKAALPNFSVNDYFRHLKIIEQVTDPVTLKPLKIAMLRSYTVELIVPILKARLLLEGYNPEFFIGGYNQVVQEALDPSSALYRFRPDIVIVMTRLEDVLPDLIDSFDDKPFVAWQAALRTVAGQMSAIADNVEKNLATQLIFQNMALTSSPSRGIYDPQRPDGQEFLVHEFNRLLAETAAHRPSVFIWDFHRFLQEKGYEAVFDPKMWYLSKNPFRQSAYPLLAADLLKYLLSMRGRIRKCIVLDLDNTLWGGIAGEDGIDGIALGHEYPGSCYRDFQKGLLQLYRRGIILAINSKNNEEDALSIIDNHPYMALRRKHFAAMRVNWNNKADNLQAIARDLNIGTDSMIFIDDNPAECELVRSRYPECEVHCLPQQPYLIPGMLKHLSGIENIRITEEDSKKGEMYRSQAARKQYEKTFDSIDDFLRGLDIYVSINEADAFSITRIAQLTQKTNQMNMTTRRYTEADIRTLAQSPGTFVFSVTSRDRFGDYGIIGVIILKCRGDECSIDSFLLSCRVIGRTIENAMLAFIADFARSKGMKTLVGEYLPTAKNRPAADLYERSGLQRCGDALFKADLDCQGFKYPSHLKIERKDNAMVES